MFNRNTAMSAVRALTTITAIIALHQHTAAAPFTWDGELSTLWDDTAAAPDRTNWDSPTNIPGPGDDITFPASASLTTVNLNGSRTVNTITFDGDDNYLITANPVDILSIQAGSITINDPGSPLTASHEIQTEINLITPANTWTIHGTDNTLTLSNAITGAGDLTKEGTGTLTLTENSTFNGDIFINAGTLDIGPKNTLSDNHNVNVNAGATLALSEAEGFGALTGPGDVVLNGDIGIGKGNQSSTFSGTISGTGDLLKKGTGTLTLTGNNTFTGAVAVQAGTLALGSGNILTNNHNVNVDPGATLAVNAAEGFGALSGLGDVVLSGNMSVNSADQTSTFDGVISGNGNLIKRGAGTFTLTGANTYTGDANIQEGTLSIAQDDNLGNPANQVIISTAQLHVSATHSTSRNFNPISTGSTINVDPGVTYTINGILSGLGGIDKTGDGTLTLANPTNALTSELEIIAGTVQITEPLQTGGLNLADATTLDGHAPDMPPAGDAQPGQALTVNGNVSVVGTALVNLSGADGLDREAALGDGDGKPGATGGSFDATGSSFLLTDTSRILLQGGDGGSANLVDRGDGDNGGNGGTLTATVTTFSLSNSARINVNGGIGGIASDDGDGGNGGNGGSLTANATTLTLTNDSMINLNGGVGGIAGDEGHGGNGGNGGSLTANTTTLTLANDSMITLNGANGRAAGIHLGTGGLGGNAGSLTTNATTITLSDATAIDQTGGLGGQSNTDNTGNSGHSGNFSAPAATTIDLTGSAVIDLSGTNGRNNNSEDGKGGNAGNAGTFSAPAAASITLADTTRINLNGGNGGDSSDDVGGTAGSAGQFNGGDGQLILSESAILTLNGGDGGEGTTKKSGSDAGALIGTFDLDLSGSASLRMRGGDGYSSNATQTGGNGGLINLTDARSMTLSGTATANLSGGQAFRANPGASSGHGGAITVDTGGSLTVQDNAVLTANGGPATDDGVISGDGGSITLASGTVTIDGGTVQLLKGTTTGSAVPGNNGHVTTTGGTFLITNGGSVETDQFNHTAGDATPTINLDGQLTVHDQTLLGTTTNPLVIDGGKLLTDKLTHDTATTPILQISDPTGPDPALTVGINNGDSTFQGTIQDATTPGSLTKTGTGTLTLTNANTHSGTTTIDNGLLVITDANALQYSTVQIINDDTLDITTHAVDANLGALAGTGNLHIASHTLTIGYNDNDATYSGTLQGLGGSLTKVGTGTQTLNGTLFYTGPTTVDAGTLQIQGTLATPAGDITIQPTATLQATGIIQRTLTGTGTIAATGPLVLGDLDKTTSGYQFPGTLNVGTHQVILLDAKHAELGSNTQMDSRATLNAVNGASLAPGNTVTVTGPATIAGPFTNRGSVHVDADQSLTFNDPVNGEGSFPGAGEIIFNQGYSPGLSPAAINFAGDLTFGPFSSLDIETYATVTAPVAGSDNDQLTVADTLTLNGTLNVLPRPDAGPIEDTPLGNEYTILSYTTRTPNSFFHTITGTLINTAFALAPLLNESTNELTLRATIPGDLNLDNKVSVADLSTFALNFGTTPGLYNETDDINSWQLGDFNSDGAITVADLSLLALNFGFDATDPTATPTPLSITQIATLAGIDPTTIPGIPEPTTITYITIAALQLSRRKHIST